MSVKISELPSASSVTSSDVVPIVQGGTTKQATLGIVASAVGGTTITYGTTDLTPRSIPIR